MKLTSDYLWPRIGIRQALDVQADAAVLVQPVLDRLTVLFRKAHPIAQSAYEGGARQIAKLRAEIDKAIEICLECAAANSMHRLRVAVDRLSSLMDRWEYAMEHATPAQPVERTQTCLEL